MSRDEWRKGALLLLALEVSALLVWLPSILWPFTVSWDENTFFLVAQRLLHGELPYTTTFENKSPLGLIFQTGAMAIVGPSPSALRFVAALVVGLTAFLLAVSAPSLRNARAGYLVGVLFVLVWGTLTNGLVWMSEVNVVLLFAVAWYVTMHKWKASAARLVCGGLLIGLLPLFRVNWALVAIVLFISVLARERSKRAFALLVAGAITPTVITVTTYSASGNLPRLWAGMVELPRGLGDTEGWRIPTLSDDQLPLYWLVFLMLVTALVLMSIQLRRIRNAEYQGADLALLAAAWALTLGAWVQPYDFPYQTLQFLPILALAVGRLVQVSRGYESVLTIPLALAVVSVVFVFWGTVLTSFDWRNDARDESDVVAYVSGIQGIENKTLWVPDQNNFLYWRLDKKPIIPLASQPYLVWEPGAQRAALGFDMKEGDASKYVFDMRPDIIVSDADYAGSFYGSKEAGDVWRERLQSDYSLKGVVHGRAVWERVTK